MMRWFMVAFALALLIPACSSGDEEVVDADAGIIVDAEPTPDTFDASDPEQLAGVSTSPSKIESGDCFNEYIYRDRADFLQQITTLVGCDGPHDREAYLVEQYPGISVFTNASDRCDARQADARLEPPQQAQESA